MPKRIMIIDEDPDLLELLNVAFRDEGYNVIVSTSGEILELIYEMAPDLLLLDVQITPSPRNGGELCIDLKARRGTKRLPVILASGEPDMQDLCYGCGADDYICKPFDLVQLTEKVARLIHKQPL